MPHPAHLPAQVLTSGNYLANPVGLNLISTSGPGKGNLLTANGGAGTLVEITPNTAPVPGLQVGPGHRVCTGAEQPGQPPAYGHAVPTPCVRESRLQACLWSDGQGF